MKVMSQAAFLILQLFFFPVGLALAETPSQKWESHIEVRGDLELGKESKVSTLPFSVIADFNFSQKQSRKEQVVRTVRKYETAVANIQIGKGKKKNQLQEGHDLITIQTDFSTSPLTPTKFQTLDLTLEKEEVELLQNPGDPRFVDSLIPKVASTKEFRPPLEELAPFLGLDAITSSDLIVRVAKSGSQEIVYDVDGSTVGSMDNAVSRMTIGGSIHIDAKSRVVRKFSLDIQERRELTPAAPGYAANIRVAATQLPAEEVPTLATNNVLDFLAGKKQIDDGKLLLDSKGGFALRHSSNWHVISDQPKLTTMRYVVEGGLLGQCSISKLAKLPGNHKITIQKYREEVGNAIKGKQGQIVDVTEFTTSQGIRGIRVVVGGVVSEVPVQWVYYHLDDENGNRLGIVFTLQQENLTAFGSEDQLLVDSIMLDSASGTNPEPNDSASSRRVGEKPARDLLKK